ncbi:MAG: hypothetical protein VXX11_07060 [Planctomycetota bacterium]|nr:hypothetical protein [Planctomycetota bacterium]
MSAEGLWSGAQLNLSSEELWWRNASWDSAIERVEGLMVKMQKEADRLDTAGWNGFEDKAIELSNNLEFWLEELQANQISTARLGFEFRNAVSVFEAAKGEAEENDWVQSLVDTIEISFNKFDNVVTHRIENAFWLWMKERCDAAVGVKSAWCSKLFELSARIRLEAFTGDETFDAVEAQKKLDGQVQFLKHHVETLTKAEIEGWNQHFVEQKFHEINESLLLIEKALCEVSAAQVEWRSEIGARCRNEVRDTLMDSELSDEALLRIDDFCQKRWQRIMAENGGGLFDFWDWNKETAEERQQWNEIMKDYAAYIRAKG